MGRTAKVISWIAGTLVVLIAAAVGTVYFFGNSPYVISQIESHANVYAGRKTTIGKLSIDWGATSHIHVANVQIANADWGKAPDMLKAEEVDFDIRLWPLLHGDFVLPRVVLRKPEIYLERNDKDQSNWSLGEAPVTTGAAKIAAPKERHQTPLIGRIEIAEGKIGFRDAKRKIDLDGTVSTATGKAGGQPQAEFSVKGQLEKQALSLHFVGGSALMLRDTDTPYPVDLDVAYGQTKLNVKGTLQDPIQWKGADVQLSMSGPDLADIYPLLSIPGPPTPPYQITGRLDHSPGMWRLNNMKLHAGDSDLAGGVTVDQREKPSKLTAKLTSQHLAFADLAPLVGASPGKTGNASAQQKQVAADTEAKGNLFPDVPLHTERLRAMTMDVSLDAKHVVAPNYLPVEALAFRVEIKDGNAVVRPLTLAFGGGSISGELGIDARSDDPGVRTDLKLQDVDLATFFRGSRFFDTTKGKVQGHVVLTGTGKSLAKVMGTADGQVDLAMAGGSVSSLMVSLAGLQIADALALYVTGDNQIPLRCALTRMSFARGDVTLAKTLIDTQKSVLHADGQLSLGPQTLKLRVTSDPKQFDLLDLHAPVKIEGKIRSPSISIDRLIPIPTPVLGTAKDVACDDLTRQILAIGQ